MQGTCIKCGKKGSPMIKQTVSKGITYRYYYVKHLEGNKIRWCYVGKELPKEYQTLVHKSTQTGTRKTEKPKKPKIRLIAENNQEMKGRGSLAWFGRQTHNLENKNGAKEAPDVQRSRARIPPPAPRTFSFVKENLY